MRNKIIAVIAVLAVLLAVGVGILFLMGNDQGEGQSGTTAPTGSHSTNGPQESSDPTQAFEPEDTKPQDTEPNGPVQSTTEPTAESTTEPTVPPTTQPLPTEDPNEVGPDFTLPTEDPDAPPATETQAPVDPDATIDPDENETPEMPA